jgi:hypothetical protein
MDNWKIVGQIASGFGIIFIVFAAFQAFVTYQLTSYQYVTTPPAGFIQAYILSAMLPFLLFAVLSFVVGAVTMRHGKSMAENQAPSEAQAEAQSTETAIT